MSKECSRMEDGQTVHSGDNHGAIHDIEVQLDGDNPIIPAVNKLNTVPIRRTRRRGYR